MYWGILEMGLGKRDKKKCKLLEYIKIFVGLATHENFLRTKNFQTTVFYSVVYMHTQAPQYHLSTRFPQNKKVEK